MLKRNGLLCCSPLFLPSRYRHLYLHRTLPHRTRPRTRPRCEGVVVRSSPDKSTLTVGKRGGSAEMTIQYDGSTKCVSQEHGSKKVNDNILMPAK